MNTEKTKITLPAGEDGSDVVFYVLEQTRIAGKEYLLVTDEEDGDGNAYVLVDTSKDGDSMAAYEFIEDEAQLDALSGVFSQMLEDITLVN